jgi:hypothetical protein
MLTYADVRDSSLQCAMNPLFCSSRIANLCVGEGEGEGVGVGVGEGEGVGVGVSMGNCNELGRVYIGRGEMMRFASDLCSRMLAYAHVC